MSPRPDRGRLPDADSALHHAITPDREPLLPRLELLNVILEKLEFAVGG
jgi:hypothetical protein